MNTAPARLLATLPLGTRVVVRYRIDDAVHGATDALGEIVARQTDTCTVRTRSAGDVVIALADVTAAKTVPPPPAPRRG
ncbi:hypothetical protein GCM10011512_18290 [Tersicoccus solisilvae]|uniref:Histone acetyltransferase Rv0428c-like SH3 domain-containing protein n=1 Tax=Tersicoccus solisilvae TaxID=1882339 RepID=A0ABQ1P5L4_9MICC|nr:hypothetical protein [Tersicoccus solisilvae]GGC91550.1 hypothetical protein GCM10011512_18290 [Tersicoccus solisilvae]